MGSKKGEYSIKAKVILNKAKQARNVLFKAIAICERVQNSSELNCAEAESGGIFKGCGEGDTGHPYLLIGFNQEKLFISL